MRTILTTILTMIILYVGAQDQVWTYKNVKFDMGEKHSIEIGQEIRLDDEGPFYRHLDIGVSRKLTKTWSAGLNMREVYQDGGVFGFGHRPQAFVKFKKNGVSVKTRYEHQFREGPDRPVLRVKVDAREKVLNNFYPFIANEFFVYDGGFNRNRSYAGIDLATDDFWGGIYYMYQLKHGDQWVGTNVIGLSFGLKL